MKFEKTLSVLTICLLTVLLSCSCGNAVITDSTASNNTVQKSIGALKSQWQEIYSRLNCSDYHFEIKNTRVVKVKENDIEHFSDLDYCCDTIDG